MRHADLILKTYYRSKGRASHIAITGYALQIFSDLHFRPLEIGCFQPIDFDGLVSPLIYLVHRYRRFLSTKEEGFCYQQNNVFLFRELNSSTVIRTCCPCTFGIKKSLMKKAWQVQYGQSSNPQTSQKRLKFQRSLVPSPLYQVQRRVMCAYIDQMLQNQTEKDRLKLWQMNGMQHNVSIFVVGTLQKYVWKIFFEVSKN